MRVRQPSHGLLHPHPLHLLQRHAGYAAGNRSLAAGPVQDDVAMAGDLFDDGRVGAVTVDVPLIHCILDRPDDFVCYAAHFVIPFLCS